MKKFTYLEQEYSYPQNRIINLIKEGRYEEAVLAVKDGASPNETDDYLNTPIHYLASRNRADEIRELINYGANYKDKNSALLTPLFVAIQSQAYNAIDFLLHLQWKPSHKDEYDRNIIHLALEFLNPRYVKIVLKEAYKRTSRREFKNLINAKTKSDFTPMHYAVVFKDVETVKMLAKHGARPYRSLKKNDINPPFYHAVAKYDWEQLLQYPNAKECAFKYSRNKEYPLLWFFLFHSINEETPEMLETLIFLGADVNYVHSPNNDTILHAFAITNKIEYLKIAKKHGADFTLRNSEGKTPLDYLPKDIVDEILNQQ